MKFGKEFQNHLEETLPEWRDKFLCYKPLKKLIKRHLLLPLPLPLPLPFHLPRQEGEEEWFMRILNEELDKFNDFYVDKEEDFIIRLQELKERIEIVRASKSGVLTSKSEFSEEMLEIRKAFVTIHGEMVLLKNYSSLNFAGLLKILKKYDKRTGALLSLPFTQLALQQPFFTMDPLTRLVRECEGNLELLFPLEAEVVESGPPEKMERCNNVNVPEASSSVQEEVDDVYRSTLAAMKAIRGLRKASSTYNPLSLAQFFHGQDDDDDGNDSGVVTSENSGSQNKEAGQQSVHSSSQNKEADQESGDLGDLGLHLGNKPTTAE